MTDERPFDVSWVKHLNCGRRMTGFPCFGGTCYRCEVCVPRKTIRLATRMIDGLLCLSDGAICCGSSPMLREVSKEKWNDPGRGPSNRGFRCPRCGSRYQVFRKVTRGEAMANRDRNLGIKRVTMDEAIE